MASLDSRHGRAELEGKAGQDTSVASAPGSHVTYGVEEPGFEGYSAGDGTHPGHSMMQKVKEKATGFGNHLKGKESSDKDPHPEVAYISPEDGKRDAVANLQEGKQHGGVPIAALDNDVPAEVTRDYMSSMKDEKSAGRMEQKFGGQGNAAAVPKGIQSSEVGTGYEEDSEETLNLAAVPKGTQSSEVGTGSEEDNEGTLNPAAVPKGTQSSEVGTGYEEDSEETLNLAAVPKGTQSSEVGTGYEEDNEGTLNPAAVPKGTQSSEVGTGYEEDTGEETLNPAAVPKYDEGVKPRS